MAKILELVIIALIVGILGSGAFELLKEYFLKLNAFWRIATLVGGIGIAVGLAVLDQVVPDVEQIHVTVPVPQFSSAPFEVKQVSLTAKAPILPSVVFGLLVAFFAVADTIRQRDLTRNTAGGPGNPLFDRFIKSPLFFYPALALAYKTFLLGQTSAGFWSIYVVVFSILSGPAFALLESKIVSIGRSIGIVILGGALGTVIALAAIF
jgi:hypothetical protein